MKTSGSDIQIKQSMFIEDTVISDRLVHLPKGTKHILKVRDSCTMLEDSRKFFHIPAVQLILSEPEDTTENKNLFNVIIQSQALVL